MEYLALYRKYRPVALEEMVGQKEIRKIISSSIKNGTISHAYLFSGPRGTGKTTTAKIMAKMVNCEHLVDDNPCNECASCLSVMSGSDIIEIDAASNNGVDEIRDLREKANLVPSVCRYKVYIIDEVHMLTTQAFNALLKTLEEPPKHVIFILATTEYYKIPSTITSRCQKFQFNKIDVDDIVSKLREISNTENIDITDDALYEIAKISDGGMRDSINFLDQLRSFKQGIIDINDVYDVCGNVSVRDISNLLLNVKNFNLEEIVVFLENLSNNGKNYSKFLEEVMFFLKDLILYKKNVSTKLLKVDVTYLNIVAKLYSIDDIFCFIEMINSLIDKIKFVSRQSVVVISNFMIITNKFNNDLKEDKLCLNNNNNIHNNVVDNEQYDLAFDFTSNTNKNVNFDNLSSVNSSSDLVDKIVVNYNINKDIIINNAFALADKKNKLCLQEKWGSVKDYLTDNHYAVAAGKFIDAKLEVVGGEFIIFTVLSESLIDAIASNIKICNDFVNMIFDGKYNYVVITDDNWNYYREEYINNLKKGIKYQIKEFISEKIENNEKKEVSIVDKLFDIVGEENIEFN